MFTHLAHALALTAALSSGTPANDQSEKVLPLDPENLLTNNLLLTSNFAGLEIDSSFENSLSQSRRDVFVSSRPQKFILGNREIILSENQHGKYPELILEIIDMHDGSGLNGQARIITIHWSPMQVLKYDSDSPESVAKETINQAWGTSGIFYGLLAAIPKDVLFSLYPYFDCFVRKHIESFADDVSNDPFKNFRTSEEPGVFLDQSGRPLWSRTRIIEKGFKEFILSTVFSPTPEELQSYLDRFPNELLSGGAGIVHPLSADNVVRLPVGITPTTVNASASCLIVTHPSVYFDFNRAAKQGIDSETRKFSAAGADVVYIVNPNDEQDLYYYPQLRHVNTIFHSDNGSHLIAPVMGKITIVGGYFGDCVLNSISCAIRNYSLVGRTEPLQIELPMDAIFEVDRRFFQSSEDRTVSLDSVYKSLKGEQFMRALENIVVPNTEYRQKHYGANSRNGLPVEDYLISIAIDGEHQIDLGKDRKKVKIEINFLSER